MAAQNLMLTAFNLGLGTCWVGFTIPFLDSPNTKSEFNVPDIYVPVVPIIVGYPDGIMPKIQKRHRKF